LFLRRREPRGTSQHFCAAHHCICLNVPGGAYVVVKRLPERDGEFEYQIKNIAKSDERVVRESELKPTSWRSAAGRRV
jgi:hypothetical protein